MLADVYNRHLECLARQLNGDQQNFSFTLPLSAAAVGTSTSSPKWPNWSTCTSKDELRLGAEVIESGFPVRSNAGPRRSNDVDPDHLRSRARKGGEGETLSIFAMQSALFDGGECALWTPQERNDSIPSYIAYAICAHQYTCKIQGEPAGLMPSMVPGFIYRLVGQVTTPSPAAAVGGGSSSQAASASTASTKPLPGYSAGHKPFTAGDYKCLGAFLCAYEPNILELLDLMNSIEKDEDFLAESPTRSADKAQGGTTNNNPRQNTRAGAGAGAGASASGSGSGTVASVKRTAAAVLRPTLSPCDRLVAAILQTLNSAGTATASSSSSSSAAAAAPPSPSVLAQAVTCLAFLVNGHSYPDSVLGVESNVLQMVRLCLNRTVYPAEDQAVWDTALSRMGLLALLRLPRVHSIASVQADVCAFCSKWLSRLAGAASASTSNGAIFDDVSNTNNINKSGRQSKSITPTRGVNASGGSTAVTPSNTSFFPLPDSSPSGALSVRAAVQMLAALAALSQPPLIQTTTAAGAAGEGAVPLDPFAWLRMHFLTELGFGTSSGSGSAGHGKGSTVVRDIMWLLCSACPICVFETLNLAKNLANLQRCEPNHITAATSSGSSISRIGEEIAAAIQPPLRTLVARLRLQMQRRSEEAGKTGVSKAKGENKDKSETVMSLIAERAEEALLWAGAVTATVTATGTAAVAVTKAPQAPVVTARTPFVASASRATACFVAANANAATTPDGSTSDMDTGTAQASFLEDDDESFEVLLPQSRAHRAATDTQPQQLQQQQQPQLSTPLSKRRTTAHERLHTDACDAPSTTFSLTSLSPIAMAERSQTPPPVPVLSKLAPPAGEPKKATGIVSSALAIPANADSQHNSSALLVAQQAHQRVHSELLLEQRRNTLLKIEISKHSEVVESKDAMLRKVSSQMALMLQQHDQALLQQAASQEWADSQQKQLEQQAGRILELECRLAQAEGACGESAEKAETYRGHAEQLQSTLGESHRMMDALQASILQHEAAFQYQLDTQATSLQLAAKKENELMEENSRLVLLAKESEERFRRHMSELQRERDDAMRAATAAQQELSTHRELIGYINKISGHTAAAAAATAATAAPATVSHAKSASGEDANKSSASSSLDKENMSSIGNLSVTGGGRGGGGGGL